MIVDGAHAFAHLDFKLDDLDCDYYGTSLHKWLFAPHGTGLLYVRKDKIAGLWPLMAAEEKQTADIRKFEEIGTHPARLPRHRRGARLPRGDRRARKQARLLHLRDRWASAWRATKLRLLTSLAPGAASGVATVAIEGVDTARLQTWLWDEHRILTTPSITRLT